MTPISRPPWSTIAYVCGSKVASQRRRHQRSEAQVPALRQGLNLGSTSASAGAGPHDPRVGRPHLPARLLATPQRPRRRPPSGSSTTDRPVKIGAARPADLDRLARSFAPAWAFSRPSRTGSIARHRNGIRHARHGISRITQPPDPRATSAQFNASGPRTGTGPHPAPAAAPGRTSRTPRRTAPPHGPCVPPHRTARSRGPPSRSAALLHGRGAMCTDGCSPHIHVTRVVPSLRSCPAARGRGRSCATTPAAPGKSE